MTEFANMQYLSDLPQVLVSMNITLIEASMFSMPVLTDFKPN